METRILPFLILAFALAATPPAFAADPFGFDEGDYSLWGITGAPYPTDPAQEATSNGCGCFPAGNGLVFAHLGTGGDFTALRQGLDDRDPDQDNHSWQVTFVDDGQVVPELPIHLSTQANVTNAASARFWASQGVRRLNLARELGLEEIRAIGSGTGAELEVFVHGALCISYSGRCLLSSYFTGRNANQGDCAHPCRYRYALVEEKRPGQYFPVEEDERGTYIFNSRDLCLLLRLPELVDAGVDAVKIEGRMKSVGYVGAVVRLYRLALDWIGEQLAAGRSPADLVLPAAFRREMEKIGTRGQSENFFSAHPSSGDMLYDTMRLEQSWVPAAVVRSATPLAVETRHSIAPGDHLEYLGRSIEPEIVTITGLWAEDGTPLDRAHPGRLVRLHTDPPLAEVEPATILRKKIEPA